MNLRFKNVDCGLCRLDAGNLAVRHTDLRTTSVNQEQLLLTAVE